MFVKTFLLLLLLAVSASAGLFGGKKKEEEKDGAARARAGVDYMRGAMGDSAELRQALAMLDDPNVIAEVQQMMSDPKFKAEMEKYTSDPRFQQSVEQANEMLGESAAADMLKDPKVYEQYLKMFSTGKENMMRGVQHMQAAMADPKEMAAAMEMLKDPDTMAEVERMMADPEFQREMQQYTMGADFQNAMSRAKKQVDDMMKDPNKLANLQAQMEAMLKQ
eukprot:CAMPEP_0118883270 /NCGR_PEP_ID=MMETSP1163-20130328/22360_1 /TAXON_ID=124430 /ORGANISM="Phaeomonas parva, Strain CCMP2877" /LENGTH=220 /DNA_ID=CAMNT_0006820613 /DNA_START=152 /DNA_END=814 /DNA_ORIENTATION=+